MFVYTPHTYKHNWLYTKMISLVQNSILYLNTVNREIFIILNITRKIHSIQKQKLHSVP